MGINNTAAATADIREWLERALASERGIEIVCASPNDAIRQRQRIYTFRAAERKDARKIYDEDHPEYGKSVYDGLIAILEGNCIRILKTDGSNYEVKEL